MSMKLAFIPLAAALVVPSFSSVFVLLGISGWGTTFSIPCLIHFIMLPWRTNRCIFILILISFSDILSYRSENMLTWVARPCQSGLLPPPWRQFEVLQVEEDKPDWREDESKWTVPGWTFISVLTWWRCWLTHLRRTKQSVNKGTTVSVSTVKHVNQHVGLWTRPWWPLLVLHYCCSANFKIICLDVWRNLSFFKHNLLN